MREMALCNLLKDYLRGLPFIVLCSIVYNELFLLIKNTLVNIEVGRYVFISVRLVRKVLKCLYTLKIINFTL